jgi:HEAT repeat protein
MVIGLVVTWAGLSACGDDKNQKISSIYEMKANPTERNEAAIRRLVESPDRDVRATALNALVALEVSDGHDLARHGLDDRDGFVRATAAKLLGDLAQGPDADVLVARLVEDQDPIVRRRSAEALDRIGGPAAVAGLARGLADPIDEVRLACARGLRHLDPEAALPELLRIAIEDPSYDVRVQAVSALGETGAPEAVPVFEQTIVDENEFVRAATAHAREVHARAARLRPTPSPTPTPSPVASPSASKAPR